MLMVKINLQNIENFNILSLTIWNNTLISMHQDEFQKSSKNTNRFSPFIIFHKGM